MFVPDGNTYDFGGYRLEPARGLFRDGRFVYLPPKEYAVLCSLAARIGGVVGKEQLVAEVWPRENVSDESLARCIYALRRALDNGDANSHIQTVRGRGYRIATDVKRSGPAPIEPSTASSDDQRAAEDLCRLGFGRLAFASRGDTDQAIRCFEKALTHDANCAAAYAGLGEATILQAGLGWMNTSYAREMLRGMADMAQSYSPDSADVYALSAMICVMFEWDWSRAVADAATSARLGGGYKTSLAAGSIDLCQGRTAEALVHFEAAVAAAPFVPHCRNMLNWGIFATGDFERAYRCAKESVETMPSVTTVYRDLAVMASCVEQHADAVAAALRCVQLADDDPHAIGSLVTALYRAGREDEACDAYARVLRHAGDQRIAWAYIAPETLLVEGRERCLDVLETALADRCCMLSIKLTDPRLDELRDEPSFQRIAATVLG